MALNSPGKKAPEVIDVFVEIPKGSSVKYEYDKENEVMRVDRYLYTAMFYPGDYGFVPGTLAKDGDPLDGMVLVSQPGYPGTVVSARPVGVLQMDDEKGRDEKIVCVPVKDPRFDQVKDIKDVPEHTLKEIKNFFENMKVLEPNKWVKVTGWGGAEEAKKMIKEAIAGAKG